ncbi:MAG: DNA repair protein RecN [Flavobacteriaceae bacterium]|nr:DNA repair protein RecN [Flavobacteriaceae bacterium]
MIRSISIKNFALIDDIQLSFGNQFNVITGETGSGKSIVLEALSLALGSRADLSAVRDAQSKCVVEVLFEVSSLNIEKSFEELDLDYEPETFFRREILPSGKSRAFINDTPVNLDQMRNLGYLLVDIHTQRQTASLTESNFLYDLLDAYSNSMSLRDNYQEALQDFRSIQKKLTTLEQAQQQAQASHEYNKYQLDELQQLSLYSGIQEELEQSRNQLQHATDIEQILSQAQHIINQENLGLSDQLNLLKNSLSKLENFGKQYAELSSRIQNIWYELDDIASHVEDYHQNISHDPNRLDQLSQKLSTLYALQNKHKVTDVEGLLEKQSELEQICALAEDSESVTAVLRNQMNEAQKKADELASQLSKIRTQKAPELSAAIAQGLGVLGMEHAQFVFNFQNNTSLTLLGKDKIDFLFSANKGMAFGPLHKIASGGELSRIMLVIKSIMANHKTLPCLIMDEIDTGVSGEMAKAMANLMKQISKKTQLIGITHLPQIAATGDIHIKVFKSTDNSTTKTYAKALTGEDRILEIAQMLDGNQVTKVARLHAEELLN